MIPTPVADIIRITGAMVHGLPTDLLVSADVEVDRHRVVPGGLFVVLPRKDSDPHDDGQDAAAAAMRAGAVAVLSTQPLQGVPCLVVDDPLAALRELVRRLYIAGQEPLTFGITGSRGKSATADLLATVLARLGPTLGPVGSYEEVALPLTALRREVDTRFAVLEYNARSPGRVASLRSIVQPHAATVLDVGATHGGELLAALDGLDSAAINLLHADDPLTLGLATLTAEQVVTFGTGPDADYRADAVELDAAGHARFTLVTPQGGSAPVSLRLRGGHHVTSALAVAANVLGMGLWRSARHVADLLSQAQPARRWRLELSERPDGVTVVDDAFRADPTSMRAALRTLAVMGAGKRRRTVAVLGPMAGLGEDARQAQVELGRFLVRLDLGLLVVVGPEAGGIHAGAVLEGSWGSQSRHVPDVDAAIALLRAELRPGDVVLVKGARGAGLTRVAAALLAAPLGECPPMRPAQ